MGLLGSYHEPNENIMNSCRLQQGCPLAQFLGLKNRGAVSCGTGSCGTEQSYFTGWTFLLQVLNVLSSVLKKKRLKNPPKLKKVRIGFKKKIYMCKAKYKVRGFSLCTPSHPPMAVVTITTNRLV